MSPESVTGYPRWQGAFSRSPRVLTIAMQEVRNAWNDQWGRTAIYVAIGYALISVAQLFAATRSDPGAQSWLNFVNFLGLLRWAALGVAAVMAGPALLDDAKRGALELYLSRAVDRRDYLLGKTLAVFAVTLAVVWIPALFYVGGSFVIVSKHPDGWAWAALGSLGYAALWAFAIAGIGLGISCVMRSARAATLVLFGAVAVLDLVIAGEGLPGSQSLLVVITRSTTVEIVSPLAALQEQVGWLFPGAATPYTFPWWWGLIYLGAIGAIGWALVVLRAPRLKGVEV